MCVNKFCFNGSTIQSLNLASKIWCLSLVRLAMAQLGLPVCFPVAVGGSRFGGLHVGYLIIFVL